MSADITNADDEVEASKAPLIEHLKELRSRLIIIVGALIVGFAICFFFVTPIFGFLLGPFEGAVDAVNVDLIKEGKEPIGGDLIYTQVLEFFFVKLKLALFGGIVLAFPVLSYHVYRFVAPGLYKNEKRAFLPYVILSPVLFLLGATLVFTYVFPYVLEFGLRQQQSLSTGATVSLLPKVSEYLSLATTLFVAFGLSFQLPVVLSLLGRVGIVSAAGLKRVRRFAIVGIAVFAAVVTPPDPITQIALGAAIYLLYEISIISVTLIEKKQKDEDAAA